MADLATLHPALRPAAEAFVRWLKAHDSRFTVTSALRSRAKQAELYRRYQQQGGSSGLYTVLPPGRSMHELGLAFDLARFGIDPGQDELLAQAGAIWRDLGGHWAGPTDPVHFEGPKAWRALRGG